MERTLPQWEAMWQVTHLAASGIRKEIYHHALHQEGGWIWLRSGGSFCAGLGAGRILFLVMEKVLMLRNDVAVVKTQEDHCTGLWGKTTWFS